MGKHTSCLPIRDFQRSTLIFVYIIPNTEVGRTSIRRQCSVWCDARRRLSWRGVHLLSCDFPAQVEASFSRLQKKTNALWSRYKSRDMRASFAVPGGQAHSVGSPMPRRGFWGRVIREGTLRARTNLEYGGHTKGDAPVGGRPLSSPKQHNAAKAQC